MGRASEEFDRKLFTLKLSELSRQMQIESVKSDRAAARQGGGLDLIRMVDGQLAVLSRWLEGVDRICREVWQTQGKTVTPEFVRDILVPQAMTLIGARVGVTQSSIDNNAVRTNRDPHAARHSWAMKVNRLKPEVVNRYEIEARELEYKNAPDARLPQKLQSTGIIPGQFQGTRQPPPLYRPESTQIAPNPYFPPVWEMAMGRGSQKFEETKPKPASSDPATWRSRGDECKKLADEETQIVRGTQRDRLLADCEFTNTEFDSIPKGHGCLLPTLESATVLELRKGPDEHLKVRFEALATEAGMALGCAKDVLPLKFWLYRLFLHLEKTKSQHLFAPTHSVQIGSKVSYRAGGIITNVYEASANFCFSLEKQTLEAEHESSLVQNSAKSTQTQTSKSTTNDATPTQAVSRAVSKPGNRSGRARKPVESKPKDRRAMVKANIEEVRSKTGKRITKKDIWSKAGYKSRAEFERWERQDPKRPNKAANDTFTRILREKPHLK